MATTKLNMQDLSTDRCKFLGILTPYLATGEGRMICSPRGPVNKGQQYKACLRDGAGERRQEQM